MNCEGGTGSHRAKVFSYHPLRLVQNDFRNKIIVKLSYLKLYAKQMNRKGVGYSNDPFSIFCIESFIFFIHRCVDCILLYMFHSFYLVQMVGKWKYRSEERRVGKESRVWRVT